MELSPHRVKPSARLLAIQPVHVHIYCVHEGYGSRFVCVCVCVCVCICLSVCLSVTTPTATYLVYINYILLDTHSTLHLPPPAHRYRNFATLYSLEDLCDTLEYPGQFPWNTTSHYSPLGCFYVGFSPS